MVDSNLISDDRVLFAGRIKFAIGVIGIGI